MMPNEEIESTAGIEIDDFRGITQKAELANALKEILRDSPFSGYFLVHYTPVSLSRLQVFSLSFGVGEWADYIDEVMPEKFPVAEFCAKSIVPCKWENLFESEHEEDPVVAEAASLNGLLQPLHGPGSTFAGIALLGADPTDDGTRNEWTQNLNLIAPYVMHALQHMLLKIDAKPALTSREKDCLLWAAEGKTNDEIGMILGISERTVRFHLCNVGSKMRCKGRNHTVTKSIFTGVLLPGVSATESDPDS